MALRRDDEQAAIAMINQDRAIADWTNHTQTMMVRDRSVYFRPGVEEQWRPVHNVLVDRIMEMRKQGFNPQPMINFLYNLEKNPSEDSKVELYGFLEFNRLPITLDGHFLAYKKVRHDWMDVHTGTISNKPGTPVSMPRDKVDADRTRTCSTGLHVCSGGYLNSFGGARTLLIKVNPEHVVSVPIDYKNSKMRVCKYYVVRELLGEDVEKAAVYVT